MRNFFDKQLDELNIKLIEMGILIENAIKDATDSIIENDEEKARSAIDTEIVIDNKERDIESMCYRLLLQQQPVAGDLRTISSAMKMVTDMERIGDQAADIAHLSLETDFSVKKDIQVLAVMAKETSRMVTRAIDAFVRNDYDLAVEVIDYDDVIDDRFQDIKEEIIKIIKDGITSDTDSETMLDYMMVAKYYERIGDHATNIAEWVIFSITGSREVKTEQPKC